MKQKLGEEYLNRTKSILKTKLNGKKYDKSYQHLCDPSTNFYFQNSEMDTYRLREPTNQNENVTRYRFHHTRAAKERLYHGKWVAED